MEQVDYRENNTHMDMFCHSVKTIQGNFLSHSLFIVHFFPWGKLTPFPYFKINSNSLIQ